MKLVLMLGAAVFTAAAAPNAPVTFSRDVAPVLERNCQGCHRPGEAAPFSLLTYQDARPWAKAMKEAVLLKKMPPWFADPHYGQFRNDRSMSQQDVDTLVKWVDAGAPEGNPKDLPKPLAFVDGWNIGKPDVVFEMPQAFPVPAAGTVEYQYVILPYTFTEDRWVQMTEVRPGNRALVHHVIAFVRDKDSKWYRDKKPGEVFVPQLNEKGDRRELSGDFLGGYAPGMPPMVFQPGQARLIKAGSDIVFQLHYAANGKPGQDMTRVGVIFAKELPKERVMTLAAQNRKFTIPPGDPNYQVDAEFELAHDAKLSAMLPHMHQRGKDFEYRVIYPTGESQTILRVPRYDFSWQLWYLPQSDIVLPKGTKIVCTAHFDNSPNNPSNPDPAKAVKWGDQTWEEMMIGFFDVTFPADMDPKLLTPEKKKTTSAPPSAPAPRTSGEF
jgi:hypothetical protein